VAARAALFLLSRLLDVEKNKLAGDYLREFLNLDLAVLRQMELHRHILAGNRLGAFRLISLLTSTTDRKATRLSVEQLITDQDALRHYLRWAERNNQQVVNYDSEEKAKILKSLDLQDEGAEDAQIASASFAELVKVATEAAEAFSGHVSMSVSSSSLSDTTSTPASTVSNPSRTRSNRTSDSKNTSATASLDSSNVPGRWRAVQVMDSLPWHVEPSWSEQDPRANTLSPFALRQSPPEEKTSDSGLDQIHVAYRKLTETDIVQMVVTCRMPFPPAVIASLLRDLRRRREWDLKFVRGRRLGVLSEHSDIVRLVFKSFSSPYKYRDFCLLRAARVEADGTHLLVARSIVNRTGPHEHKSPKENKDNVRAVLLASGYILTPTAEGHTKFTFVAQMDKESVLIVSPDLLGETNELRESILQIQACLERDQAAAAATAAATTDNGVIPE
jgi:hypothetical protein